MFVGLGKKAVDSLGVCYIFEAIEMAHEIAPDRLGLTTRGVEMLFAHLKRNLGFTRLRLRGLRGAEDEFLLAATAQNLKRLAKLVPA